jgi:hypothetical protein
VPTAAPTTTAPKAGTTKTTKPTSTPRVFITPKKRSAKAPPEPGDE